MGLEVMLELVLLLVVVAEKGQEEAPAVFVPKAERLEVQVSTT